MVAQCVSIVSLESRGPDAIGCVWTGEFDLNTLRVDGEIFAYGKKKFRIKKLRIRVDGPGPKAWHSYSSHPRGKSSLTSHALTLLKRT